ncbi:MAG TPA: hypothetical protein VEV43_14535 [Actinomycetota bacterium]|nr:hypothetical protein [Actinomycetota bacterium]
MRFVAALIALSSFVACGGDAAGSEAFCDATRKIIELGNVEEVPPEVDTMVEEAPDEIKDATETVRDVFVQAFEDRDLSQLQSQEFQDAATELREYAVENCDNVRDITNE